MEDVTRFGESAFESVHFSIIVCAHFRVAIENERDD